MAKRARACQRAPAALLALLIAPLAHAEWKFTPAISDTATFSDNIALQPAASAHSSFVNDIAPLLSVRSNGPRLQLVGTVQGHLFSYTDKQPGTYNSSVNYQLDLRSQLIDELLSLDASATRGQNAVSAFGQQTSGNLYANGNRADVSTYTITPMLRHRFGGTATGYVRYSRNRIQSDNELLGTTNGDNLTAALNSGENFRTIGWGLSATRNQFDDTRFGGTTSESALADLRYRLSNALSLTANSGYDRYEYSTRQGETAGRNWSAGFIWTPSARTRLQMAAGRHFYGKTGSMALSYRSHRSTLSANYGDSIVTSRQNFLGPTTPGTIDLLDNLYRASIPDPVARQQAIDAYIAATGIKPVAGSSTNYFSNRFLRQKQLQLGYALESAHGTTVVSIYKNRSRGLSNIEADSAVAGANLAAINDNVDQIGANAAYSLRLNQSTQAYASLNLARSKSVGLNVSTDTEALRIGASHRIDSMLRASAEIRHARGGVDAFASNRYRENAISATIIQQF